MINGHITNYFNSQAYKYAILLPICFYLLIIYVNNFMSKW